MRRLIIKVRTVNEGEEFDLPSGERIISAVEKRGKVTLTIVSRAPYAYEDDEGEDF